jgi:hypothetical protein
MDSKQRVLSGSMFLYIAVRSRAHERGKVLTHGERTIEAEEDMTKHDEISTLPT